MKKINSNLIPLNDLIDKTFKTKKERAIFEEEYKQYRIEKCKEVLLQFGQQLKKARQSAGVTQEKLAQVLHTDIANISRIEHGRHNLTVDYIVKVAQVLKRPVRIEIL
jgi:ribosome-binding protein aMBF1 (putative translation factor)